MPVSKVPQRRPPQRGGARAERGDMPRLQWLGLRARYDFWGGEIKRYYQLETLTNSTERMLRAGDKFITPSIQEVLGPAPITSLTFELFQEGKYQIIFRMRAANTKRAQAVFGFVVAKKQDTFSAMAAAEHANLRILHPRAPEFIVKPYRGGLIYLPDRHRRPDQGREIYAYVTQWFDTYHELGVGKNHQFYINVKNPRSLTVAQTEDLKGRMVEIIARTYDPKRRDCMELPQIASGDFIVTKPQRGPLKLKLISCRRLMTGIRPARLIQEIAQAHWEWVGRVFRLPPADPAVIVAALERARGKEEARQWLAEYRDAVIAKQLPGHAMLPLEALRLT